MSSASNDTPQPSIPPKDKERALPTLNAIHSNATPVSRLASPARAVPASESNWLDESMSWFSSTTTPERRIGSDFDRLHTEVKAEQRRKSHYEDVRTMIQEKKEMPVLLMDASIAPEVPPRILEKVPAKVAEPTYQRPTVVAAKSRILHPPVRSSLSVVQDTNTSSPDLRSPTASPSTSSQLNPPELPSKQKSPRAKARELKIAAKGPETKRQRSRSQQSHEAPSAIQRQPMPSIKIPARAAASAPVSPRSTTAPSTPRANVARRDKVTLSMLGAGKPTEDLFKPQNRSSSVSLAFDAVGSGKRDSQLLLKKLDDLDVNMMPSVQLRGFTPELPKKEEEKAKDQIDLETGSTLQRRKTLSRPERKKSVRSRRPRQDLLSIGGISAVNDPTYLERDRKQEPQDVDEDSCCCGCHPWRTFARCVTFYAPDYCLKQCCGMTNPNVRQAWREKMGLVTIIFFLCLILAFLTFGLQYVACGLPLKNQKLNKFGALSSDTVVIRGDVFSIKNFQHPGRVQVSTVGGRDVSWMFPISAEFLQQSKGQTSACSAVPGTAPPSIACSPDGPAGAQYCHKAGEYMDALNGVEAVGQQSFLWNDIKSGSDKFVVFSGNVLNLANYFKAGNNFLNSNGFDAALTRYMGKDATRAMIQNADYAAKMRCLVEQFKVGILESETFSCMTSQLLTWISFAVIISVILIRFGMALLFNWFLHKKFTPPKAIMEVGKTNYSEVSDIDDAEIKAALRVAEPRREKTQSRFSHQYNSQTRFSHAQASYTNRSSTLSVMKPVPETPKSTAAVQNEEQLPGILRTIMLVTCYSEGESGIRATLDSLARTDYPDTHKLLFIIADGIITGSGNSKSTPDILIDMLDLDPQFPQEPEAYSYVAIADGQKRHNMAKVYAGRYHVDGHSVPAVVIVKCGTAEEQQAAKPGNRGKRDSQIILMHFLSKVMFNDRMTPLEYDLFTKMTAICGPEGVPLDRQTRKITPDQFELVLMVDADTKVMPECMRYMSYTMASDPSVIGLCGETRIANKAASWVSAIQVFEYYLAHFMAKSFESVFGTVTCLPGCFCMYRIKATKPEADPDGNPYQVPILVNPDIVTSYSEHVVDTLHKKNLLLLGEDRYLSTLMLKTFPKRHMVFVPQAVCHTQVPDEFRVLLSQRRRWINSTIHNLLELVMLKDLCGIFCFSMQFVIFMELIGTAVLPAAISFTIYLIVISFFSNPVPIVPLALLAAILGLPALLIMFASTRWGILFWMLVYLLALPIWNFVLPAYAFWHFDDFSWGETRKVEGQKADAHGEKEGEFDHTKIIMRRWSDYEKDRRHFGALSRLNGLTEYKVEEKLLK